MSYTEAKKLLTAGQLDEFKMDVDEYIKQASAIPVSKEWQVALEKAAARQRVTRLEAILVHLQQHIEQLFGKQEQLLQEGLENLYKREYYHTAFELDKGFEMAHEFGGINTNKLNDILKKPWAADGSNFSSRVWQHKQNLVNTLQQEMTRAVIRGDDFRTATKNISDKMNVSQSAAGRLVMTESAFFASKGMADCLREFGVDEYEFIATLDRRTSQICRDMDKKVFKLSEFKPGTTAPPLHCYCRSHIAPYFADAAISERIARGKDGKTYMIPSNMNYKDWERVYVKKEISLEQWKNSLSKQQKDVIISVDNLQNYRKVKRIDKPITIDTPKHSFSVNRLADMPIEMYLSEKANLKPKEAHTIYTTLKKVADMIDAPKGAKLPRVYIVSPTETSAIAAYLATDNNLFIMQGIFAKGKDLNKNDTNNKERGNYAGEGYLGTAIHEMLHWKDAQIYELSKGKITDQGTYLRYRIAQDKRMLKKLGISEKEVKDISKYAEDMLFLLRYDEIYAEYRTKEIMNGW